MLSDYHYDYLRPSCNVIITKYSSLTCIVALAVIEVTVYRLLLPADAVSSSASNVLIVNYGDDVPRFSKRGGKQGLSSKQISFSDCILSSANIPSTTCFSALFLGFMVSIYKGYTT